MTETLSRSQTGLSSKKGLVMKAKKKKIKEKGYPKTVTHNKTKYQLLCSCNTEKDAWGKSKSNTKTQPVLAYKIDPKLRDNCAICHVPPHVVMKSADVRAIDKEWDEQRS